MFCRMDEPVLPLDAHSQDQDLRGGWLLLSSNCPLFSLTIPRHGGSLWVCIFAPETNRAAFSFTFWDYYRKHSSPNTVHQQLPRSLTPNTPPPFDVAHWPTPTAPTTQTHASVAPFLRRMMCTYTTCALCLSLNAFAGPPTPSFPSPDLRVVLQHRAERRLRRGGERAPLLLRGRRRELRQERRAGRGVLPGAVRVQPGVDVWWPRRHRGVHSLCTVCVTC